MLENKLIDGFEPVVDYDTKLSNFEGPLDLLLFLIKRSQISIRDVFVSEVTSQYLKYIENLDDVGLEKASEYLSVAVTILEIKSREVLPQINFDDEEIEENPREMLTRKLEEYELYKQEVEKLKSMENVNRFYKQPEEGASDVHIVYTDFNLEGLIKAFTRVMERADLNEAEKTANKEIPKEVYTVRDKIEFLKNTLLEKHECSFFELFNSKTSRSELITTFQAMLELLKLQFITVEQNIVYDDITLFLNEERSDNLDELGEIDEYN